MLQRDFFSFACRAFYELNPAALLLISPHMELMAAKLEALRLGLIRRLIINAPPRGFKSHLASIALPAWFLAHCPTGKVASVCYGQELTEKFARDCRRLMQSPMYERLFRTRLSDRQAVHDFETTEGGVRLATSFGGAFTGRGADLIIVDDPTKADDVLSESRRSTANMWFDNTLLSRLDDKSKGGIVIVMQRQHQDDLMGHVVERDGWEVVSLPAIAIQDEIHVIQSPFGKRIYNRHAGEVLHPERESAALLQELRSNMPEFTFSAQYQQSPIPFAGSIIKREWLRFQKAGECPARFDRIICSWDTANKVAEFNDYSVCVVIGVIDKFCYVLDVFRERLLFPDLKRKVIEVAKRYRSPTILIEDKASGTQLIQDLRHELYGVEPYEPPAGMEKEVRVRNQTPLIAQGFLILPEDAPWLGKLLAELLGYPGTRFDDQVDALTQALAHIRESNGLEVWAKLGRNGSPPRGTPPFSGPSWQGPQFFC